MLLTLIKGLCLLGGAALVFHRLIYKFINNTPTNKPRSGVSKGASVFAVILGIGLIFSSLGMYYIKEKHSGHVTLKVGAPLKSGQLIARTSEGQRGLQSALLNPGYGYDIRYPWVMDIEEVPDYVVPTGKFAVLTARDGKMNPTIAADEWSDDADQDKMLMDVEYFVDHGGQRGIQRRLLTTGIYRLNQFQWSDIKIEALTEVDADEVLVIESKFGEAPAFSETSDDEILSVPLVESDKYRGIVNKAYPSGFYAIHPVTQKKHNVSIVLQTFIYGGGYKSKSMDLVIDPETDKLKTIEGWVEPDEQAHGAAFEAKTKDNHTVRYDVRVLGQIEPVQAPRFVGTIKDPAVLDDKVIEPFTRNILSNITLEYEALELKNKKKEIGERVSELLRDRTAKTGFRTKTVEITNIDIPAIVLIPGKIESASIALKSALIQKEKSVEQAIKVRNMQDQADNQEALAIATVKNKAADQEAEAIGKLAEANRVKSAKEAEAAAYRITEETEANEQRIKRLAKAYKELSDAIGEDNAASILLQETINEAADKFNGPDVVVYGNGEQGSIVDAHMISQSIKQSVKPIKVKAAGATSSN